VVLAQGGLPLVTLREAVTAALNQGVAVRHLP